MIAAENPNRDTRFPAIAFRDYMQIEVPPVSFVVPGMFVEGSSVLFSAREKSGKGLLMIDLLISVATETPFLDRPVKGGVGLYIALEENIGTIKTRLHARHPDADDIPLYVVQLDGSMDDSPEFYIDTPEGVDGLAELIQVLAPTVVVIDTLREAHRGRENESDDMAPRLKAIRALAHKTNTTIIVTHHAAKMTGGARGSTAIRAAFDDVLEFTREDVESDTEIRGVLRAEGRNLPKVVEHIAFNASDHRWMVTNAPPTIATPNLRQRIIDVLDESQEWMTAPEIAEGISGVALGSVQNQLSRMLQEASRPFAVDNEKPRKGSPRKYHCLQSTVIPHDSSHTNDVTNEERPENIREFRPPMQEEEF